MYLQRSWYNATAKDYRISLIDAANRTANELPRVESRPPRARTTSFCLGALRRSSSARSVIMVVSHDEHCIQLLENIRTDRNEGIARITGREYVRNLLPARREHHALGAECPKFWRGGTAVCTYVLGSKVLRMGWCEERGEACVGFDGSLVYGCDLYWLPIN